MRKKHINNYWKGTNTCKVPYCQNPAVGIDAPECSEECYKFDNCMSDKKRNHIINKFIPGENEVDNTYTENISCKHAEGYHTCASCGKKLFGKEAKIWEINDCIYIYCSKCYPKENTTSSTNKSDISLNINGEEYNFDKIIKILKKHKEEEDKKYLICDKCGIKYLDNKKFDMIHENLENDTDLKPGMAIGYQSTPFITGIQITSKCGTGKKIKLCDNCIKELVLFLKGD